MMNQTNTKKAHKPNNKKENNTKTGIAVVLDPANSNQPLFREKTYQSAPETFAEKHSTMVAFYGFLHIAVAAAIYAYNFVIATGGTL